MRIRLLLLVVALCGCAHEETILRNDAGETKYCYLEHNGSLSSIGAVQEYNRCLNEAGSAGFRRVPR